MACTENCTGMPAQPIINPTVDDYFNAYTAFTKDLGYEILNWAADEKIYEKDGTALKTLATKDWFLSDFTSCFTIAMGYLAFVFIGSFVMWAFKIPSQSASVYPLSFVYNFVQVALCAYMTIEAGVLAYRHHYTITPCNAFNYENPPIGSLLWLFYISKVLDFADTFFIIVKKNWKQLSFLHVYHHVTIFSVYWLNLNIGYDGDIYLTILLNGGVHTVMYLYYFVSMHTRQIWLKSSVTLMQLGQFCCMMGQAVYLLANNCQTFPKRVTQIYLVYIFTLFLLFVNFFLQSYVFVKKDKSKTKTN